MPAAGGQLVHPGFTVSLLANSYYGALRAAGVPAFRRRRQDAGLILCYHNVVATGDGAEALGLHEARKRFERQMGWLAAHYDVVPLHELVDRLTRGALLRSVAAVTFDDGYTGVFEHAVPILDALGIPATVFIVADAAGRTAPFWWDGSTVHRAAGWQRIREALRPGIDLGAHSVNHPSLPGLTDRELEHEVVTSRALIHRATGTWPQFFAYPYGHWDTRVRDVVQSAGYRAGLTLDFGLNGPGADHFALRRINVPAGISDAAFEAWTAGCRGLHIH
jgi:peptidoglycan/xylan/chitin deacetylase (PgdA/CDA1 family)